mgnify:CR=1 FL=1
MIIVQLDSEQLHSLIHNAVRKAITESPQAEQTTDPDRWFDLTELCAYHPDKPTKATVYGWVNAGIIPVRKGGKKLRFLKSEIDNWLKQGRKKTLAETVSEADTYLKKKGGNNG